MENLQENIRTEPLTDERISEELERAGYLLIKAAVRKDGTVKLLLKPAGLKSDDGEFRAAEVCSALGLQADCRIFPCVPADLLVLTVMLEAADEGE
ncbi:hypothetical protein EGM51_10640 [Verrucomicrobia bacterium S94]|nr:hypothetical protein EGM51_10640 [Verrucomicrobia bacterium S94]